MIRKPPIRTRSGVLRRPPPAVSDTSGLSDSATVTVIVTDVPPTISAGSPSHTLAENEFLTFGISGDDPDGDTLILRADGLPPGAVFDASARTFSWTPDHSQAGTYTVTFTVTDTGGLTADTDVAIIVTDVPRAPTISAGSPSHTLAENEFLSFEISGADPDGDDLIFRAGMLPEGAVFDVPGRTFSWRPTYRQAGTHTVTFSVTDSQGLTAVADTEIIVTDVYVPPRITSSAVTEAEADVLYTYPVTAEHPGDIPLTFALAQAPEGMTADPDTGLVSWTPSESQAGVHEITVRADDGTETGTQTYTLTVAPGEDRTPPAVSLSVPSQVLAGGAFDIVVRAADSRGVAQVSFYMDGLLMRDSRSEPWELTCNAPDEAGRTLAIRVTATDEAGNSAEAAAEVTVTDDADTAPPVIGAMILPLSAAPDETVLIRAEVTDDRGVAEIRFAFRGTTFATAETPPYEGNFTVPPDAVPGGVITITAEARDTEGNTADAQGTLTVSDTPDTEPPTGVTLRAPAEAPAGRTVRLEASAQDNAGVFRVTFSADGAEIGADTGAPYEMSHTIPHSKIPGSSVVFFARASDFSGNTADSAGVRTQVTAPGNGFVAGEVHDDTSGLPVPGITVRAVRAGGQPLTPPEETVTDARGRYRFLLPEGDAAFQIIGDGYVTNHREVSVRAGAAVSPWDARMTPLGDGFTLNHAQGGDFSAYEGRVGLHVPPDAFAEDMTLTLTELSGQGLPAPLPPGWTPVFAVHAGPENRMSDTPCGLNIRLPESGVPRADLIAVRLNPETREWVRAESALLPEGDRISVLMGGTGTTALVLPDTPPAEPEQPDVGGILTGTETGVIPPGITADILPSPEIIFMQPSARSDARAVPDTGDPLPSGTRIRVHALESYERTDGTRLNPEPVTWDIVLYQYPDAIAGNFVVSPSEMFSPSEFSEGVIRLEARRPEEPETAVIGPAGGTAATPPGLSLTIPADALGGDTPVCLRELSGSARGLAGDPRFEVFATVEADLGGAVLSGPAILTVHVAENLPADARTLAVRPVITDGVTYYELVAVGTVSGTHVTFGDGGTDLPLPGIREGGRYHLIRMNRPAAYLTGSVTSGGVPVTRGLVSTDSLPFVSLPDAETNSVYTLAAVPGSVTVSAEDLTDGSTAAEETVLTEGITELDLPLVPELPSVISVTPADGAGSVALTTPVTLTFSRAMNPETVTSDTFGLETADGTPVEGVVTVRSGGLSAVFRPLRPLGDSTVHAVALSGDAEDTFGNPLTGNRPDGSSVSSFTTADTTPPPRPEPGQITMSIPSADAGGDSVSRVAGTQGSAEPGTLVTVINVTAGTRTGVIADSDGSFSVSAGAEAADDLEMELRDSSGNVTMYDPGPFRDPDGTTVIGSEGGVVEGPGGIRAAVPAGAVPDGTVIKIGNFSEAALNRPVPDIITFLGGIELIMDVVAGEELRLSIPLPPDSGLTPESQILVFKEIEVFGEPHFSLNNIARVRGDRIETASPPFPGARTRGRFWMGAPEVPTELFILQVSAGLLLAADAGVYAPIFLLYSTVWHLAAIENEATVSPIFVVPKDQPFTLSIHSSEGDEIATRDYGPLNTTGGIRNVGFSAPGDEGPVGILSTHPPDGAGDVGIGTEITVTFDRQITLNCTGEYKNDETGGIGLSDENSNIVRGVSEEFQDRNGMVAGLTFRPDRRLRYNTTYSVRFESVCNRFDHDEEPDIPWTFKTFSPSVLGSFEADQPSHISVLDDRRIAVADGRIGAGNRNSHGVILADVGDPENPRKLAECAIAGNTLGVRSVRKVSLPDLGLDGPAVLAASGGLDSFSELAMLRVGDDNTLERVGSVLLGVDTASLRNGFVPFGVPPHSGIPRQAALYQNDNVYVATMGIGIQAVRVSDGIRRLQGGDNMVGGTFTFGSGSDSPVPVTVETAGDVMLAGDLRSLRWLEPDLTEIFHMDIPARDIHAVRGFPVTPDENRDLAFVLGQDRILYIVDVADRNILSGIRFGKAFGSDFPKSLRISPYDLLAYISTAGDVHIADISRPAEEIADWDADVYFDEDGDGRDDRILGKVSGLPGAGSLDIGEKFGYVGDAVNGKVHTFVLRNLIYLSADSDSVTDNGDDDNENGTPDRDDPEVGGENDMIRVRFGLHLPDNALKSGRIVIKRKNGRIRLWKAETKGNGQEIVFDEDHKKTYDLSDPDSRADFLNDITGKTLWTEGCEFGRTGLGIAWENSGGTEISRDEIGLTVYLYADLDIDSDNDNLPDDGSGRTGHPDPARSPEEDRTEDVAGDSGNPGKVIWVNDTDIDDDGVPNYADGYDKFEGDGKRESGVLQSEHFVPLILELPEYLNPDTAKVRFIYAASDPEEAEHYHLGEGTETDRYIYVHIPAAGKIRIWKADGNVIRSKAALNEEGDYVRPGVGYSVSELGEPFSGRTWRFFIEAVEAGEAPGDQEIRIEIDPDGDGSDYSYMPADSVRFTAVRMELRDNGNVVNPLNVYAYPYIDETPAMPNLTANLRPAGLQGITLWRLKIEYRRENRRDEYVSDGIWRDADSTLNISSDFFTTPDGEEIVRGGKATLSWEYAGKTPERQYVFRIRGRNPSEDDARAYIGDEPWFFRRLVRHEGGLQNNREYLQFNEDGPLGPKLEEDYRYEPNRGHLEPLLNDWGWGMAQVNDCCPPRPELAHILWDWKANIDKGREVIEEKRREITGFWENQVREFLLYRADYPAAPFPDPRTYEDITFHYDPGCTDDNNCTRNGYNYIPDGNNVSFIDAILIKYYNGTGNERRHFISWNDVAKRWRVYESATFGENIAFYVEWICETEP